MRKRRELTIIATALLLTALTAAAGTASNAAVTYSGHAFDAGGAPLDGVYTVSVRYHDGAGSEALRRRIEP